MAGELVVLVDEVRVRQKVALVWVPVTLLRGMPVGEVADDTRDHLLRTGQIGRANGAPYVHAARSVT